MLRIIPTLLLSGRGLVKTRRFAEPVYLGDPRNVVRIFNEKEVDELVLLDIGASAMHDEPSYGLIRDIVSEAFMPVCYGGGVRSVKQARSLLRNGVEKIAINTAALEDPSLARRLADEFGSQCVVASIDVKRDAAGVPRVHSHASVRVPESDPVAWAQRLVEQGAGEVLLQSVDRDGTMQGLDLQLLRSFDGVLGAPLIAGGGVGSTDDIRAALRDCGLSGVAVGARFVLYGPHRAVLVTYLEPSELHELQQLAAVRMNVNNRPRT